MDKMDLDKTITVRELIELAKFLKSEDEENGEYDRALLDVVTYAAEITTEYAYAILSGKVRI
jgi:hypothetical protein